MIRKSIKVQISNGLEARPVAVLYPHPWRGRREIVYCCR